MPSLDVILDGDGCWPDARGERLLDLTNAGPIGMALLPGGMMSGKPSVTIRIDMPDGKILLTQTSLALLETAVRAFQARLNFLADRDR
jgi:hypothetical protein